MKEAEPGVANAKATANLLPGCAADAIFTRMQDGPDDDLIKSITQAVMTCLDHSGFFQKLDDILCPKDGSRRRESCCGGFRLSESILQASGFDSAAISDVLDVLRSQGGFCDCEILYNVVESSRLKAQYWRERARGLEEQAKHVRRPPSDS